MISRRGSCVVSTRPTPTGTLDPAADELAPLDLYPSDDGRTFTDGSGVEMYITTDVVLYDDGQHGDGAAGDGVYAGNYSGTAELGTYSAQFHAEGVSPSGTHFTRSANLATVVTQTAKTMGVINHEYSLFSLCSLTKLGQFC